MIRTPECADILIKRPLDLRLTLHIRLIEGILVDVGELIDVGRCADVTQQMRRERSVDIFADRPEGDIHARKSDVIFGEFAMVGKSSSSK
jgi:hypothetical protein